jgi:hypothetical protein
MPRGAVRHGATPGKKARRGTGERNDERARPPARVDWSSEANPAGQRIAVATTVRTLRSGARPIEHSMRAA